MWACLGLDVSRGGFHSHGAHHTMVLMALTTASGLLAPLVSPLSQGLFAGLSCLSATHWPYSRSSYLANPTRQTSSAQHVHPASVSRPMASEQTQQGLGWANHLLCLQLGLCMQGGQPSSSKAFLLSINRRKSLHSVKGIDLNSSIQRILMNIQGALGPFF